MICPSCKNDKVEAVQVSIKDFYICGSCSTVFLPKNQLLQLDRKLFSTTRKQWRSELEAYKPQDSSHCLLHPESKINSEKISGYSHEALISPCCELFHFKPSELSQILAISENIDSEFKTSYKVKNAWNPLKTLVDILFGSKSSSSNIDIELEELQYSRKIEVIYENAKE